MRWASAISRHLDLDLAVEEVSRSICEELGDRSADLAIVFASPEHCGAIDRFVPSVRATTGARVVFGCSAGGVIGAGHEIEHEPALSVTVAKLPDVTIRAFHLPANTLPNPGDAAAWESYTGVSAASQPSFLLLPDPFSFDAAALVESLEATYGGSAIVGGLASGDTQPMTGALFFGDSCRRAGAVGLALSGDIGLDTAVAQGCRPIGQPFFVTRCRDNVILELDGRPAVTALQEVYENLSQADRALAQHSLFIGVVMSPDRQEYRQGDFLIRNLVGADARRGTLTIGARLSENWVVQFHLRDARTSAADLEAVLQRYSERSDCAEVRGALLFSCLGRGRQLYGVPDHDSKVFKRLVGDVALGGFFCNGEIGPVQGSTFLHGYTSSFGMFRRATR